MLTVTFPGNENSFNLPLTELSRTAPALPGGRRRRRWAGRGRRDAGVVGLRARELGARAATPSVRDRRARGGRGRVGRLVLGAGYGVGDEVFYTAEDYTYGNGFVLVRGSKGEVVKDCGDTMLTVTFPGNENSFNLPLTELSRTAPTLPGGYSVGDEVLYTAEDYTYDNGFLLMRGSKGEVVKEAGDTMLTVTFPGNENNFNLPLTELSRTAPTLPGGYSVGDEVFYTARDYTFDNGFLLMRGSKGEVVKGYGGTMMTVTFFPDSKRHINLPLTELSRTRP